MLSNMLDKYNAHLSALKIDFRSYSDALRYVIAMWLGKDSLLTGRTYAFAGIK